MPAVLAPYQGTPQRAHVSCSTRRIEAIKAKQASRAADAMSAVPPGSRVYSKHVAIPIPAGRAAGGSGASTPHGSPARRDPLLDAITASLPQLEAPPVWQGFQASCQPAGLRGSAQLALHCPRSSPAHADVRGACRHGDGNRRPAAPLLAAVGLATRGCVGIGRPRGSGGSRAGLQVCLPGLLVAPYQSLQRIVD